MKTKHLHGRVLAVAAAAAVGLTGLSSAAFADDAAGTTAAPALAVGNIQPNTKGSLIIHKHEDGTQNPQGTPDGKTQVTAKGVEGVEFTAFPITNLDLTKQEDWNGLADVKVPADACGANNATPVPFQVNGKQVTIATTGVKTTKATDANGEAKIENLPVAAYLVCETSAPSNVVQPAAPFFVTIPFPNNEKNVGKDNSFDKNWLYDVNVYPKNKLADKPVKDLVVSNNGLVNDGQLTYTVSQTVPAIAADHSFSEFIIGDKMSAGQDAEEANVVEVKVGDALVLAKGTHYKVEKRSDKLYVGLTKEGLATIKGHQGEKVVVTFKTKANQIGQLTNEAETYVKTTPGGNPPENPPTIPPVTPPTPPQPTNKVFSSWGDLVVAKQDTDNQKKLAGATFEVYNAAKAYDGTCTKEIDGAALTVNGKATFTTDATGTVKIDGLFVSQGSASQKLVDGKPQFEADGVTPIYDEPKWPNGNTHRCYVLKETAAPAGYTRPAGDDALTPVKVTPGATAATTVDVTIDNTKQDVPTLPLTGANGELLLTIGGASLVLLALGATLVARRRNEQI